MNPTALIPFAIALAAVGGVALAGFLGLRARAAPGALALAAFCLTVAVWSTALLAGGRLGELGLAAVTPLGGAAFLRFALRFAEPAKTPPRGPDALALACAVAALGFGAGRFAGPWVFVYSGAGLAAVGLTVGLTLASHAILARAFLRARGLRRRQIAWVGCWSGVAFLSLSGLAPPLVGLPAAPMTLLALPAYLVGFVYAVLRYELMDVNVWARRAVAAALALGAATAALLFSAAWAAQGIGAPSLWMAAAVLAGMAAAGPLRALADRIVYPGRRLDASEIARWRADLGEAASPQDVERVAERMLAAKLGTQLRPGDGDLAPPGPRRIVETLAGLKREALEALARRRAVAERERLAEIGMLAATVAHDLRNPMNVVAMAAAGAPADVRAEIKIQIHRMNALVRDLLDYAKPWRIERRAVDLAALAADLRVETAIPEGLTLFADPARLTQALANLIDNAAPLAAHVLVAAERDGDAALVHVCDDGPGLPPEIEASLFQPFSTRGQAGTGLGLAIVAKIMAAHGGDVALTRRPGWSTCFTLRFPP